MNKSEKHVAIGLTEQIEVEEEEQLCSSKLPSLHAEYLDFDMDESDGVEEKKDSSYSNVEALEVSTNGSQSIDLDFTLDGVDNKDSIDFSALLKEAEETLLEIMEAQVNHLEQKRMNLEAASVCYSLPFSTRKKAVEKLGQLKVEYVDLSQQLQRQKYNIQKLKKMTSSIPIVFL